MQLFSLILSTGLMIPFFAWGVYTLRIRFKFHEDFAPKVEAITLGCLALFLTLQFVLLDMRLADSPVLYLFSILGLLASTTALYGPMLVSVISHLLVNLVSHREPGHTDHPHYGAAESLEEAGDYEGALQEYLVLTRTYPKDASVLLRAAISFAKLARYDEATEFFEKGLALLEDEERALRITNRLSEIYIRHLNRTEDAVRVLENYRKKYPNSARRETITRRLSRLQDTGPTVVTSTPEGGPPKDPSV